MIERVSVSFSGGKDSTAMLLMMLEKGERIDEVVFFDTGWEFPQMYDHIDRVERETGIEVTRLHPGKPFDYWMFEHVKTKGAHIGEVGYGWATPNARWCTKVKTDAIDKHERVSGIDVKCIGIAADEAWRCKGERYPLVEWGVTEDMALAYCKERGYTWGGLYDHFRRVSCWCCPLQPLKELRELRRCFPDLWARLRDMDERSRNTFKAGWTVEQLDDRFAHEDMQLRMEVLR